MTMGKTNSVLRILSIGLTLLESKGLLNCATTKEISTPPIGCRSREVFGFDSILELAKGA
jgi:hypothetical protein